MTRINLLPWRQLRRDQQQRRFMGVIGLVAMLAVGGVIIVHLFINGLIGEQQARNQYLRSEIAKVEKAGKDIQAMRKTEQSLLDRLQAIKQLQQTRPDMVKIFDALVRLAPEDLYLTSLNLHGTVLELKGAARNNKVVSDFMRELSQSSLFGEPTLKIIENRQLAANLPASIFDLEVPRIVPGIKSAKASGTVP